MLMRDFYHKEQWIVHKQIRRRFKNFTLWNSYLKCVAYEKITKDSYEDFVVFYYLSGKMELYSKAITQETKNFVRQLIMVHSVEAHSIKES